MEKSLAYKLIENHTKADKIEKGAELPLSIDQILTHDTLGILSFLYFEPLGIPRIKTKLAVCYTDHNTMQTGPDSANDHRFIQMFASKYGIYYSKAGNGICHQLHTDLFGIPGETLIGTDSHTPTAGGLGMFAVGVGGMDVTAVMAGTPYFMTVPAVMRVELNGRLSQWVSAKDVALEVLKRLDVRGGFGWILEYAGPGVENLSVPDRATIANMGTETGATTSIFPSDIVTKEYLRFRGREKSWKALAADPEASYDKEMEIDLAEIEPLAAKPHSPGNVANVKDLSGMKVDQVVIGSCTNSSLRDLMSAAHILKSKRVHPDVSAAILPGSRRVLHQLSNTGLLSDIINAGVRILEPVCGACIGMGFAPPSGGVSLRTFNRNFKGRSGTPDAQVFLVSPETAAASALSGEITDPRDMGDSSVFNVPEEIMESNDLIIPPAANPQEITVVRGPNIAPIQMPEALKNDFKAKVLLKLGDDITTDLIVPAGAKAIPLRSNVPALSEFIFEAVDPSFAARARDEKNGVIVAGENYGQGSSREHAALCPRYLGVAAIIAKSFARIHMSNLINFGILPLMLVEKSTYDNLDQEDILIFQNVNEILAQEDLLEIENSSKGYTFKVAFDFTKRQREIILKGGLLNFIKSG